MLRKISTPDFVALDTPADSCLLAIKAIKPKKANRLFTTERKNDHFTVIVLSLHDIQFLLKSVYAVPFLLLSYTLCTGYTA